ncbi:Hsp70 family protein [bacterium D16-50]|nr:Hsp70 family protein [bacterium D16-50]
MARYYGIDLGTTNTVVYEGAFQLPMDEEGEEEMTYSCVPKAFRSDVSNTISGLSMPSVLCIKNDPQDPTKKKMLVGVDAESNAGKGRNDAIFLMNTKRFTGRKDKFEGGYTALDVAVAFLDKCAEAIDQKRKVDKKKICVTHPASYNIFASVDTKRAAVQAGFKNVSVLEEPRAALLSFLYDRVENPDMREELFRKQEEKGGSLTVLVVDIGGGTTDVTVQTFRIRERRQDEEKDAIIFSDFFVEFMNRDAKDDQRHSQSNNYHCFGGMDFDLLAMKHLMLMVEKEYEKETGMSIEDMAANDYEGICGIVMRQAEEYKKKLSKVSREDLDEYEGPIHVAKLYGDYSMDIRLKGCDYVAWVADLCDNTADADCDAQLSVFGIVRETLRKSGYVLNDLSYVFVTGGMSQYLPIRYMLEEKFSGSDIEVCFSTIPTDDVARGAALFGNYFNLEMPATVLNTNYYLDNPCGEPFLLAKEGTMLPLQTQVKENFLEVTNPVEVVVSILSGDGPYSTNLRCLTHRKAELIYPDYRGTPIDVRYSISDDQQLSMDLIVHHKNKEDEVISVYDVEMKGETDGKRVYERGN